MKKLEIKTGKSIIFQYDESFEKDDSYPLYCRKNGKKYLKIGSVIQEIYPCKNPILVPQIVFHDNPRQTLILMEMLKDFQMGEHLLLIGNQGVGKNKLADKFLELFRKLGLE